MVSDWTWGFVEFPHCWGIKEFFWINAPALIFIWKVSIEYVASNRCYFESSFFPFEKVTVDIDWTWSCWSCLLCELVVWESLCYWQSDTWFLCNHDNIAWILDTLCFGAKITILFWYLIVIVATFNAFIHQEHFFIFFLVLVSLFNF